MTFAHSIDGTTMVSAANAPTSAAVVVNFVVFQAGWFACVLGAAHGLAWAGTLAAFAIVAAHVYFARRPRAELKLVAIALLIGAVWESALVAIGWLDYPAGFFLPSIAPHWILALWGLFAITVNYSLGWLKPRLAMAAVLGAVAGPLAFRGGAALGAVQVVEPLRAFTALASGWALFTPLLLWCARRDDDGGAHA